MHDLPTQYQPEELTSYKEGEQWVGSKLGPLRDRAADNHSTQACQAQVEEEMSVVRCGHIDEKKVVLPSEEIAYVSPCQGVSSQEECNCSHN